MTVGSDKPRWISEIEELAANRTAEDLERLAHLVGDYEDDYGLAIQGTYYAALAMLAFGEAGTARLVVLYDAVHRMAGRAAILRVLYECYSGRVGSFLRFIGLAGGPPEVDQVTLMAGRHAYRDLVLRIQSDPDPEAIMTMTVFLQQAAFVDSSSDVVMSVVEVFRDSMIRISRPLIDEFRSLLSWPDASEAQLQEFFTRNPVFIDPLAREVIPKHILGTEYVTDFAVRTLSDNYVVVEIERPSDLVFTARADFTARFTHALGQILEFQNWIASNVAYARTRLPGVTSANGLLIIGRSTELSERARSKLDQLRLTLLGRIRVATYDDILEDGERLLRNVIG